MAIVDDLRDKLLASNPAKWTHSAGLKSARLNPAVAVQLVEAGDSLEGTMVLGYHVVHYRRVVLSVPLSNTTAAAFWQSIIAAQAQADADALPALQAQVIAEIDRA